MQKPVSLRAALTAAIPELRNEPDRLAIWVEDGQVRARQTAGHGFAFEYPLSVLLKEVATDIAIIAHAIVRWLRVAQPDLLAAGAGNSFGFETDILDNGTADIVFTLQLTEAVAIAANEDGSWAIDYLPEPDPLFDDQLTFAGMPAAPPLAGATSDSIVSD